MKHPRQEALHEKLLSVAKALKEVMPEGVGFTLFMFEYGNKGFTSYLSTADRADMIKLIKEWLVLQEVDEQKPEGSGS